MQLTACDNKYANYSHSAINFALELRSGQR